MTKAASSNDTGDSPLIRCQMDSSTQAHGISGFLTLCQDAFVYVYGTALIVNFHIASTVLFNSLLGSGSGGGQAG